jgi:hypothetical protein
VKPGAEEQRVQDLEIQAYGVCVLANGKVS